MIFTRLRLLLPLFLSASLLMPAQTIAGGVAEIESGDAGQRVHATLEFDGPNLRVTPAAGTGPEGFDGYLIFRDGKGYTIATSNGRLVVMEMQDTIKVLGSVVNLKDVTTVGFDDVVSIQALAPTGGRETVAGVDGEVYRLNYQARNSQPESRDMVLTRDPVVREMTASALAFGTAVAAEMKLPEPQGSRDLRAELQRLNAGVLRFGDEFQVVSLNRQAPAADRFDLPQGALQIPALPEGLNLPGAGAGQDGDGSVNDIINRAYKSIFGGGN